MPQLGLGLGLQRANRALFRGLLDQYGGAAAAYSLRALSSGWLAGDVVEVRRSSDSTTQDFTASQILNGDLVTFCGVGDGFVSTWYDQSGFANDATQATTTAQPKIVSAGALVTDADGNNTIKFDGVDDRLDCGARIVELSQNAAYVCAVSDRTGISDIEAAYILAEGDAVSPYSSNFILGGPGAGTEVLWVNATTFGSGTSGNQLLSFTWNGTNEFQAYIDGATSGTAGSATVNSETSNTFIGCRADETINFTKRKIAEIITWKSDQSANRAAIETNINDHYGIY